MPSIWHLKFSTFACATALLFVAYFSHAASAATQVSQFESQLESLFDQENLGPKDSVLITQQGRTLFEWQPDVLRVPASLTKLVTAYVAIEQWGLDKRFVTEFYRDANTLWVKGYGDPFLVSEELSVVAQALTQKDLSWVKCIAIDRSYFKDVKVPGRSNVADPYNAPLSAVAANFNTVKLSRRNNEYLSGEPQTPITTTAVRAAKKLQRPATNATERINLINSRNAAYHFAEVLVAKLNIGQVDGILVQGDVFDRPLEACGLAVNDDSNSSLNKLKERVVTPQSAVLFYRHQNSHSLADVIRGALEYSNNFMANQLFLMFASASQADFVVAAKSVSNKLKKVFSWEDFNIAEGAGLSRANKLSARQINQLLHALAPHKTLFKAYETQIDGALVRAKTGTLNGVRSFAGYITIGEFEYQFVFNFNRDVAYKYREKLLKRLVTKLASIEFNQALLGN